MNCSNDEQKGVQGCLKDKIVSAGRGSKHRENWCLLPRFFSLSSLIISNAQNTEHCRSQSSKPYQKRKKHHYN